MTGDFYRSLVNLQQHSSKTQIDMHFVHPVPYISVLPLSTSSDIKYRIISKKIPLASLIFKRHKARAFSIFIFHFSKLDCELIHTFTFRKILVSFESVENLSVLWHNLIASRP